MADEGHVVWSGKSLSKREKGIAGSSKMADKGHVVWSGKSPTRREKGIAGSSNMADGGHVVWGGKPLTQEGEKGDRRLRSNKRRHVEKNDSIPDCFLWFYKRERGPKWSKRCVPNVFTESKVQTRNRVGHGSE